MSDDDWQSLSLTEQRERYRRKKAEIERKQADAANDILLCRVRNLEAEVERLREERDTEAGIRIRAVEQMVLYRKALERIGSYVGDDGRVYCGACGYTLTVCDANDGCAGGTARVALDGEDDK